MKLRLLFFLLYFFFFFAIPQPIRAQGTFLCNCPQGQTSPFSSIGGEIVCTNNWDVTNRCDSGYITDSTLCHITCNELENDYPTSCTNELPLTIDCVLSSQAAPTTQWGESCQHTSSNCETNTYCRYGICLKLAGSIDLNEQCFHADECSINPSANIICVDTNNNGVKTCQVGDTIDPDTEVICGRGDCQGCEDSSSNPYDLRNINCDDTIPGLQCYGNSICAFVGQRKEGEGCIDSIECQSGLFCDHSICAVEENIDYSFDLCAQIPDKELQKDCCECQTGNRELDGEKCYKAPAGYTQGIWTAIGCIRAEPEKIVEAVLEVGISIAGGVALLMFLAASFMLSTSQGDPKKTSEARELITSAVIGILFGVFSVAILQFIGYDILRIPGFGG